MRPKWRKGWEGLPLLAEVYSYVLKAIMKLQGCNKQGFHPGEEKTKTKTQTKQASTKPTTTKETKPNQTTPKA